MQQQRIELLHAVFAKSRIGPGDVGVVPHLWPGLGLSPDAHPRHDIFGQIRVHVAGVEVLHHHQDHQGHIQRDIPG
jgi:hypothetical protein